MNKYKVLNLGYIMMMLMIIMKNMMTIVLMSALLKKVKNGGSLNITCVAVGSPMPFVKWRQVCIHTIR